MRRNATRPKQPQANPSILLLTAAGFVLAVFTYTNFHVLGITSACDPKNDWNIGCERHANRAGSHPRERELTRSNQPCDNNKREATITRATQSTASTSLESTLLFLYDRIPKPHWTDEDTGENHYNYQILTNIKRRELYVDKEDITLVAHSSISRFPDLLVDQVNRWEGPISFAMYLPNKQDIREFARRLNGIDNEKLLTFTSIHVVLERHGGTLPYPNNVMRNVAQENIESNYLMLMDADFIPSRGAYQYLKSSLTNDYFWKRLRSRTVFVLPAFERFAESEDNITTIDMVPETKPEIERAVDQGEIATFHQYFPPGHYPTNFTRWFEPTPAGEFSYPIKYEKRFEPYVVAYKQGLPKFWDGFRGFGLNAAVWFWELDVGGYTFEVIRDHFVVHMNHPGRKGRNFTDGSIPKLQLRRFMRYISRHYNISQQQLRYWKGRKYGNGTHVSLFCATCK